MKKLLLASLAWMLWLPAQADLRVAATVPNLGMLTRAVGGDAVTVMVMSPPDRDAHYLEARPSMMVMLRRADLVVAVGAELEVGWLPAAIQGANNRRVQPGQPGYFEATRKVDLLGKGRPADRALGDVHPHGNPHIYLDPERMALVGYALAERLGELLPERADEFQQNAERFSAAVAERMPDWRARAKEAPGVLLYHEDADYLLHALDVPLLGYIEPLPGIPPTASHLRSLVRGLADQQGVIWSMNYHPTRAGEYLARELGWRSVHLPSQVAVDGDVDAYWAMIDAWVRALETTE